VNVDGPTAMHTAVGNSRHCWLKVQRSREECARLYVKDETNTTAFAPEMGAAHFVA
jgi:hypothetical protein